MFATVHPLLYGLRIKFIGTKFWQQLFEKTPELPYGKLLASGIQ